MSRARKPAPSERQFVAFEVDEETRALLERAAERERERLGLEKLPLGTWARRVCRVEAERGEPKGRKPGKRGIRP